MYKNFIYVSFAMLLLLGLQSTTMAQADYCTSPVSETVWGLDLFEIDQNHSALARRIHGIYRDTVQASLPPGHNIVSVHITGSGFLGGPGNYSCTLEYFYCVEIGPPIVGPVPIPLLP